MKHTFLISRFCPQIFHQLKHRFSSALLPNLSLEKTVQQFPPEPLTFSMQVFDSQKAQREHFFSPDIVDQHYEFLSKTRFDKCLGLVEEFAASFTRIHHAGHVVQRSMDMAEHLFVAQGSSFINPLLRLLLEVGFQMVFCVFLL